jgi:tetratricopeptide (TPR) repeat protein
MKASYEKYVLLITIALPLAANGDIGPKITTFGDLGVDVEAEKPTEGIPSIYSEIPKDVSDVRLTREELRIDISEDYNAEVNAVFELEGPARDEPLSVYFPSAKWPPREEGFSAVVNGEPAEVEVVHGTRERSGAGSEYIWAVPFSSGFAVVEVNYEDFYGEWDNLSGTFIYSLETGAAWAGTIGKLDIYINLHGLKTEDISTITPGGYKIKGDTVEWHFTDYEPSDNIGIGHFTRGGYYLWAAHMAFERGYLERGRELCKKAIAEGNNYVQKWAKFKLGEGYYFTKGDYEKALALITETPMSPYGEKDGWKNDDARHIAATRCELMLEQVDSTDDLRRGSLYSDKHMKWPLGSVGYYGSGVKLYLENKKGASKDEKEYFLEKLVSRPYPKATPEYWKVFSEKYPDSPLTPLALFLYADCIVEEDMNKPMRGEIVSGYAELAPIFAEASDSSSGSLKFLSAKAAANSYIFAGEPEKAAEYIEIVAGFYRENLKYESHNGFITRFLHLPENVLDFRTGNWGAEKFFISRALYYTGMGQKDKAFSAIEEYKSLFGNEELYAKTKRNIENFFENK